MPSLFKVLSLLAFTALSVSGALASPRPDLAASKTLPACPAPGYEMCRLGTRRSLQDAPPRNHAPCSLSNAERLARHLPLKPPTRRSSARRATSSPVASPSNRGYIQIISVDASGNPTGVLGYVSRTTYVNTQYLLGTLDDALLVGQSGDRDLVTLNSDTPSPVFLGLVQGRDDTSSGLAKGSYNYLYLASTEQTSPNATPQSVENSFNTAYGVSYPSESAVWTRNPATNALTVQWINPDGSLAPTTPFIQGSAIYFSGDPEAFHGMYVAPVQRIAFLYIPA